VRARRPLPGLALAVWLAWLGLASPGLAGVTAEVEPREIELGESALLRVVVDDDRPATVALSGLTDFLVTPRGQVVGNRTAEGTSGTVAVYRFELIPKRAGELTLPPLAVTMGEKTTHTPALRLVVRPRPAPPPDLTGREFALDAQISNAAPFVGELFRYTLRLFRSRAVETAAVTPPEFPGFAAIPLPGQRDGEITVGGRHFAVTEVDYLLRPTRSGQVDLAPGAAACREVADPDHVGGARSRTCAGPPLAVTVRPLPPFPGPGTWSGLVGRANLTVRLEPPGLGVGMRPTLVVTVSGRGNLPDVSPPPVPLPQGVPAQALAPQDDGSYGPTGYQGTRTFRYLLAAMPPNGQPWPEIRLTFFDPETASYTTVRARPEMPTAPASGAGTPEPAVHPDLPPVTTRDATPPSWPLVLLLALAGPGLFLADGIWRQRRSRPAALAGASPSALAEALRQAAPDQATAPPAVRDARSRLERLLYSGRPVDPAELATAMASGRRVLEDSMRGRRKRGLRRPGA